MSWEGYAAKTRGETAKIVTLLKHKGLVQTDTEGRITSFDTDLVPRLLEVPTTITVEDEQMKALAIQQGLP